MSENKRTRRPNTILAAEKDGMSDYAPESLDFDVAIATFIRNCRVKNLTEETVGYYRIVLRKLKELLDEQGVIRPIDVTKDHVDECILMRQESGVEDSTVNTFLRGWRAFFNYLHHEGFISEKIGADIRLIKAEKRIVQTFTKEQIKKLLGAPDKTKFTGYRNYVIMVLLLDTMIRISELVGIKTTDILWRERYILVNGKGRKERMVPFQATAERHLKEYIKIRGALDHDFLFVNIDNSPISKRTIQQEIAKLGLEAGIKGVRVSPHTFRHTGAKLYVMAGGDVYSLQRILGHTSLDIVKIYVNLFSTDVAKQHSRYSPLETLDRD